MSKGNRNFSDSFVVYLLFVVVWDFYVVSLLCGVVPSFLSSLAIILLKKREWLFYFSCDVAVSVLFFPHYVVAWSAVCDCNSVIG